MRQVQLSINFIRNQRTALEWNPSDFYIQLSKSFHTHRRKTRASSIVHTTKPAHLWYHSSHVKYIISRIACPKGADSLYAMIKSDF